MPFVRATDATAWSRFITWRHFSLKRALYYFSVSPDFCLISISEAKSLGIGYCWWNVTRTACSFVSNCRLSVQVIGSTRLVQHPSELLETPCTWSHPHTQIVTWPPRRCSDDHEVSSPMTPIIQRHLRVFEPSGEWDSHDVFTEEWRCIMIIHSCHQPLQF